jgi:putative chitinase
MSMRVSAAQFKELGGSRTKAAIVNGIADGINEWGEFLKLDTPSRIAQFAGQCAVETGYFSLMEENLNYSAKRLTQVWPKRFPTIAAANPYAKNPKALAIKTYGGRMGNKPHPAEDGWRYRGMGVKQLTGFDNVNGFNKWIHANAKKLGLKPAEIPDFVENPEKLLEFPWAFLSAGYFWLVNNVWKYAEDTVKATLVINGGKNALDQRQAAVNKAKRIFTANIVSEKTKKPAANKADALLKEYQEKLKRIAAFKNVPAYDPGKADGWHGDKTEKALLAFQKDTGLTVDGTMDEEDRFAIDNIISQMDRVATRDIEEQAASAMAPVKLVEKPVEVPKELKKKAKPLSRVKGWISALGVSTLSILGWLKDRIMGFFDGLPQFFASLDPMVQLGFIIMVCVVIVALTFVIYNSFKETKDGVQELLDNVDDAEEQIEEDEEDLRRAA